MFFGVFSHFNSRFRFLNYEAMPLIPYKGTVAVVAVWISISNTPSQSGPTCQTKSVVLKHHFGEKDQNTAHLAS